MRVWRSWRANPKQEFSLVGHVAIANGAVLASPEPLTGVTGTIVWHGANSPLSIWGVGRWKGETSEVRLSDLRLGDYLRGRDATPFRLALSSPLARLEAEGSIFGAAPPRGEAMIKADVKSSSGLSRWLGAQAPLSGLVDRYSFEGASTFSARGFSSPSVIFTAAGSRFEGTLALRFEEQRPQISGTLATHALDFDALGVAVDFVRDEGGAWSSDRFDASLLRQSDADIRVSAGRVRLMGARIQDAAISIMLKDGRLEFVLGRSAAYQGEVRGRASLQANDDARVEARLQLHFENLDVGDAMQDIAGRKLVTGRGQGQVQLEVGGRIRDRRRSEFVREADDGAARRRSRRAQSHRSSATPRPQCDEPARSCARPHLVLGASDERHAREWRCGCSGRHSGERTCPRSGVGRDLHP